MDTKAMRNAIKKHVNDAHTTTTCVWQNVDKGAGVIPRIELAIAAAQRRGGAIKGNVFTVETGRLAVIVCVEKGAGEDDGLTLADAISATLKEGRVISYTGGSVTILKPPDILPGYPDSTCYRIPIMVRYRAE